MKARRIVTIALSVFVAASVIYLVATETRKSTQDETAADISLMSGQSVPDSGVPAEERVLSVYYFHATTRCYTCRKIEYLTATTVRNNFSAELARKTIVWQPVNIDKPENRHFVKDFNLFTKSVVIVDTQKGKMVRWKNLDRIWQLVRDEPAFTDYITGEISGYLHAI
ncbi:MAG: hypothetical protein JXA07_07185 [Spirochaetes bacterium]|nr:hypothetical protein [Spirochaetota bacterium]